jgi:hypothetical protein
MGMSFAFVRVSACFTGAETSSKQPRLVAQNKGNNPNTMVKS